MHLPTKAAQPECHEPFIGHLSEWPCPTVSVLRPLPSQPSLGHNLLQQRKCGSQKCGEFLCMSGSPPAWPCILALLCSCHSLYGLKSWGQQTLVRAAWLALVMPVPCYSLLSTFFGNRIKLYSLGLEKQEFSSHSRQTKTLSKCHKQNGNKCVGSWHSGKRRIYGIDLCELTSWYCIP